MIDFFEFHIAHSEMLLTACSDQLLYNLSLIKLCSACVKQNTAVKTAIDVFSLLVGQRPSSSMIDFEQVIKPLLVWNIYFMFFLPVVDCTFCKTTIIIMSRTLFRVNLHSIFLELLARNRYKICSFSEQ